MFYVSMFAYLFSVLHIYPPFDFKKWGEVYSLGGVEYTLYLT